MSERLRNIRKYSARPLAAVVVAVMLAALLPLFASGCGAATPADAVRNFLKAVDTDNWNLFLSSVLPDQVRKMTSDDIVYWRDTALKQAGQTVKYNPGQLGMKTQLKKNTATVLIVSGRIVLVKAKDGADVVLNIGKQTYSYVDAKTKKVVTQPFSDREKEIVKGLTEYPTQKYKTQWYVNFPLQRPSSTTTQ